MTANNEPRLIKGGIAVDDRGSVSFTNDFHFEDVKRYYMIRNHRQGFIRAWHGHRFEGKYFTVVKGSALICGVKIDDWANPSRDLPVHRFVVSERAPSVLHLPGGYANGAMSLTEDAQIMVFSTSTLQDSINDDVRWDQNHWNPWTIESR